METSTGKIIEGENIHAKRPPASITKLMVAYIVMEKLATGKVKSDWSDYCFEEGLQYRGESGLS